MTLKKTYDRSYFDRWYRDPAQAVILGEHLARRVRLAVSAAEYVLEREVESVLDIGCGEAPWRAFLKRLRPRARYFGIDPSPYAVARYGKTRGIVQGGVGDLGTPALSRALLGLGARPPFDLIVCSDVLHYVPTKDLTRGFKTIGKWVGPGLAFLEFFTRDDDTEGDTEDFMRAPGVLLCPPPARRRPHPPRPALLRRPRRGPRDHGFRARICRSRTA